MSNNVKLELTPEQRKQIREATGKDASVIEFTVEELEEKFAPNLGVSELEDRIAPASTGLTDAF